MEDKKLETYRNERIRSMCGIIKNKKNEIFYKVALLLRENPEQQARLSRPAMNFFLGKRYVEFMDRKNRLTQTLEVTKYIRQNNLLTELDEKLAAKYPDFSPVKRLTLALNASFDDGRQANTLVASRSRKENERS